jgi:hypothetical protein
METVAAITILVPVLLFAISISLWAGFDTLLGTLVTSPKSSRAVRLTLGALTLASVAFIVV